MQPDEGDGNTENGFVQVTGDMVDGMDVVADLDGDTGPMTDSDEEGTAPQDDQPQEDLPDDSIHTFEGHTEPVYAVAWSPTAPDLVATGGGDDRAFIWRAGEEGYMESQGAVHDLQGHTDTVCALAFSADGSMLATGGMDGRVKVWTPTGECVQTLEGPGEAVGWIQWHPRGNVILAGSADFTAWMWMAGTGACMQVFTGHAGAVTCGGFTPDGKWVVTGGGEGDASLKIWDPKSGQCVHTVQNHPFHVAGLTAIAFHKDSAIVATASEDGTGKIVNLDGGRVVSTLTGHEEDSSVEGIAFLPNLAVAATAGMDGKLLFWDLATASIRATCNHPDGITALVCHPTQPVVFTGCLDGSVRCWDGRTGECVHTWVGHRDAIQDLALSPDGTMVLSGSEDGTARVFSMTQ